VKRREFIVGLGSAAGWPLAARAQQQAMPVIGLINGYLRAGDLYTPAFRRGLSETGYIEGQNVTIDYRWIEGHNERLSSIVGDLVSRRVAVIATVGDTAQALAAKEATQTVPIVFRIGSDPVATGLVSSLNRPGGNITGVTSLGQPLGAKRLQLVRELSPGAALALLVNPANAGAAAEMKAIQEAAQFLGLRLLILRASSPSDIAAVFASLAPQDIGGLLTTADPLFFSQRDLITVLVARRAIPAVYSDRIFSEAGGLMSYGTDIPDAYRIAGVYTGRILKGEKPVDLPVQQSTKVEFVINLKTARALGLTIPETLLATADEVIQ
jgi:putative ABC transport system substrate-binding protein